ncbi:MAG: DUF4386 domain-containing protein [Clostridiales bacterium]|nr:DUF4386 domain-containing protein [Clostridiales bacterium]
MDKLSKKRAVLVGILIIAAYSMLTYDITGSEIFGFITDVISGLSVIGIALLMYPIFSKSNAPLFLKTYMISRIVEGLLMVFGGGLIVFGADDSIRQLMYANIHIWFFILGAATFYWLFLVTETIPKFISVWGLIATGLLLLSSVMGLFGIESNYMSILLLPMILNELFLSIWLMVKGFRKPEEL